jgi:glucokinase
MSNSRSGSSTFIGVDVGGTQIKAVRLEEETVIEEWRMGRQREGWIEQVVDLVRNVGSSATVGVGVAGLVDHVSGRLIWAPHIADTDIELGLELGRRLGRRVWVDNDANCAVLAESRLGAGIGFDTVLVVMFGTGIGMGLAVKGEVFHGRGLAGEAGHMTMVPDGDPCPCGKRGCWETVVSGWRLDQGLPIMAAGTWMGRGIANLIAILDPDIVVVGGGVIDASGEEILAAARSEIGYALEGADHRESTPVVAGRFGIWAGAVGAALLPGAKRFADLS